MIKRMSTLVNFFVTKNNQKSEIKRDCIWAGTSSCDRRDLKPGMVIDIYTYHRNPELGAPIYLQKSDL